MDKILVGYFVVGTDRYGSIDFGELFLNLEQMKHEMDLMTRREGRFNDFKFVPVYVNEQDAPK